MTKKHTKNRARLIKLIGSTNGFIAICDAERVCDHLSYHSLGIVVLCNLGAIASLELSYLTAMRLL